MKNIAIIIPTYNEFENIERLVKEIKKQVPKSTIYIVDDSRKNDIGKLIFRKKIKAKYFHRGKKLGRGSAVIYGLKKAFSQKKNSTFSIRSLICFCDICLGDSTTYGIGVFSTEKIFSYLLEQKLKKYLLESNVRSSIDVFNAGVPSYSVYQGFQIYKNHKVF